MLDASACPACRFDAAEYLIDNRDLVLRLQLTDNIAGLEKHFRSVWWGYQELPHVCDWPPYDPSRPARSLLRWAGGKKLPRKRITALIQPHRRYVEPFCGAAHIFFEKSPCQEEFLNDLDPDVANFWQVIKERPWDFVASFGFSLVARAEFERLKTMSGEEITDPVRRAYRFFYLVMSGWGGEMKSPRFCVSINDGGRGNRLIGAIQSLPERVEEAHRRLAYTNTQIINGDWRACLDELDGADTFFYLDPPYPNNHVGYLYNLRSWAAHQALAERLGHVKGQWLLTLNDSPEARQLYAGCTIVPMNWASGMPSRGGKCFRNREILIANYPIPPA